MVDDRSMSEGIHSPTIVVSLGDRGRLRTMSEMARRPAGAEHAEGLCQDDAFDCGQVQHAVGDDPGCIAHINGCGKKPRRCRSQDADARLGQQR